jgi:hypothetical protein
VAKPITNERLREVLVAGGLSMPEAVEVVRDRVRLARDRENSRQMLRDKFAMAALEGLLAGRDDLSAYADHTSCLAYKFADAMMQAREKKDDAGSH